MRTRMAIGLLIALKTTVVVEVEVILLCAAAKS